MVDSIIPKLYEMCLNNEFEGIQASQENDLQIAYDKLRIFEKQHNWGAGCSLDFENNILNEFTLMSEQRGFVCGFKVAVRLLLEIYNIDNNGRNVNCF